MNPGYTTRSRHLHRCRTNTRHEQDPPCLQVTLTTNNSPFHLLSYCGLTVVSLGRAMPRVVPVMATCLAELYVRSITARSECTCTAARISDANQIRSHLALPHTEAKSMMSCMHHDYQEIPLPMDWVLPSQVPTEAVKMRTVNDAKGAIFVDVLRSRMPVTLGSSL